MSNVWTSIALRAPCTPARAKPLLQLFSGYARSQCARYSTPCATLGHARVGTVCQQQVGLSVASIPRSASPQSAQSARRSLSTTSAFLAVHGKKDRPSSRPALPRDNEDGSRSLVDAPVEPAQTTASHAKELLPEEEEGLTWRDYDPEGGMPIPIGELSQPVINVVFGGEEIDAETGNYILNVMHWRRMSGALIDSGLDFPKSSGVTKDAALQGLQFVRTLVPDFDEKAAGQRWAEEESLRLQQEIQARSIKLGIYKQEPEDVVEDEEIQQGTEYGRERSGESQLQKYRQEQEALWEKEQGEKQAQQERDELAALHSQRGPLELAGGVQPTVALTTTGPGGITTGRAPNSGWLVSAERKPWVKYYEEQSQTIKTNLLPRISTLGRLVPSLLLTLTVLGLGIFLANAYTPAPRSARLWPDMPPAVATLTALTGTLLLAFVASRIPPVWKILNKYCTIVPAYPYAFSLLGAAFRHNTVGHLASNIIALWVFGLTLHDDIGRGPFLAVFFASSCVGGLASLSYNVLRKDWTTYIFGSSGGVLGVVAAACTVRPTQNIAILGYEVPIPAWLLLTLFGAGEAYAAIRGLQTTIDHAGHLGGILAGVAAGRYVRQRALETQMVHREKEVDDAAVREGGSGTGAAAWVQFLKEAF